MHALIGIPAHSAQVHVATLTSIVQSVNDCAAVGIPVTLKCWAGDSLLPHARNALLAAFLETDCTDLVFVDADISWEPGSLVRLLKHDVDLVAGAYRYKRDEEAYPVNWLDKPELWSDPKTGLLEVRHVPMGFTRMSRAMVQKMTDHFPDKAYRHQSAPDLDCRCLFDLQFSDGMFFGEDYVFCERWRGMGGNVWLDPELSITHHGTKDYQGNIGKWLKAR
jgi:hypothetical protein